MPEPSKTPNSLNKLETKCIKSSFNSKLTENHFLIQKSKEKNNKPSKAKTIKIYIGPHSLRKC